MKTFGAKILCATVSLLLLGLVGLYGFQLYSVNSETPPPEISEYDIGDDVSFSNETSSLSFGDAIIKVAGMRHSSFLELAKEKPEYTDRTMESGGASEGFALLVEADLINATEKTLSIPIYAFVLTSGSWANSIDPTLTKMLNNLESFDICLQPYESRNIMLPYCVYDTQFDASSWSRVDERNFWLTLSTYPKKTVINLGNSQEGLE